MAEAIPRPGPTKGVDSFNIVVFTLDEIHRLASVASVTIAERFGHGGHDEAERFLDRTVGSDKG